MQFAADNKIDFCWFEILEGEGYWLFFKPKTIDRGLYLWLLAKHKNVDGKPSMLSFLVWEKEIKNKG